MATFTVTTLNDENDYGAVTTIFNPFGPDIEIPIGPAVSLREAVKMANDSAGADTIVFAAGLEGLIRLTNGEIEITDVVTIDGGGLVTITGDAGNNDVTLTGDITDVAASLDGQDLLADNSRIFNITDFNADTTLSGLTLTGGRTTAEFASGGAVRSYANLTIEGSTISGNSTAGEDADGGGIYALINATVTNSTISGNSTAGDSADGGGIYAFVQAKVTNSTISGNSTTGDSADGGGIYAGYATVTNSTISGNSTAGANADGGGIYAFEVAKVTNSIILGNKALMSDGDEIFENSGGIEGDGLITVTGNNIIGDGSDAFDTSQITGDGTAINASAAQVFAATVNNNGVDAGVLADNGGDVQTIALNTDASNPALDAATIGGTDARGEDRGYDQTFLNNGGTSDLGAFELTSEATGKEASSLIVTTLDDTYNPTDGQTSLREAVAFANSEAGAATITFAAGGQGLIRLTRGEIEITDVVTIDGGGLVTITGDAGDNDVTLTGDITDVAASLDGQDLLADNSRIFNITDTDPAPGYGTTLMGLTLTGGRTTAEDEAGGAVRSPGLVRIEDSTITGNSTSGLNAKGGGVYANRYALVNNSTISGNLTSGENADGGGVYTRNSFSSTGSTFSGNSTTGYLSYGGGVYAGTASFSNSTISGNSTTGDSSPGGGVAASVVIITNSTITGNTAEAGADGVYSNFAEVENSIILGNAGPNGLGDEVGGALGDEVIIVTGNNIIGADSAAFDTSARITGAGTAINASAAQVFAATVDNNGVDAGVLADNGGDVQTIALNTDASNPALDAATIGGTDARGEDRGYDQTFLNNGGTSDLGAFELTSQATGKDAPSLVVTTLDDTYNPTDGQTSLREAVAYANDKAGADTITFAAGGQGLIRLTNGEIEITDAVTIDGGGLVTITGDADDNDVTLTGDITDVAASLDGQDLLADNSRIFNITDENADATLSGLTLTGGRTTADDEKGGAVQSNAESLTIQDSTISGNSTAGDSANGGGFYAEGDVTLTGSTISNNSTAGDNAYGGGLSLGIEDIEVTNSTITGNSTAGESAFGGGLYVDGDAIVTNSTISGNSTAGEDSDGGGISAFRATVTNSTISGNSTTGNGSEGGGMYAFRATVANSTISGNNTAGDQSEGGGMFAFRAATVTNSIILGNKALMSDGDEIFENSGSNGGDGLITVTGNNIIGADSTAFDTSARITGAGTAINADPYKVFSVRVDNNGVTAGFLRDNGGDVQTIALLAGIDNPALDAATINDLDARGQARGVDLIGANNGGTSDLGAFELQIAETGSPRVVPIAISVPEDALSALRFTPVTAESLTSLTFNIASGEDADKVSIDASTGVISFNEPVNFEAPTDADGDNTFEFFVSVQGESGSGGNHTTTITITDANDAPVAAPATASGDEDTVISGALTASDEDGDALSFALVDGPSNGSVTVSTNGSFQFTPVGDFNGTDSFTFRASDGALSDVATATITVNPVDEPVDPVAPLAPTGPTQGDDTLLGTALNDTINALAGNDNVSGLAGDDLLLGGGGNDSIKGAAGDDRLRGNGDDDTLKGGGGDDNLKGNGGADVIRGNGGDDVIRAGGGADNVKGGGGADLIFGGGGADQLNGGGGSDTLRGNGGDDTLKGNGGADVFQFRTSDRNDTIADFRQGQDKIQIQNGVRTFEGLSIEQDGRDVLIGFGAGQVRVVTDNAGAFDESDFIF